MIDKKIAIIGLGNPGLKYRKTRHNVGFMAADQLAKFWNLKFKKQRNLKADVAEFNLADKKIILVKPNTYMNNSGESLALIKNQYKPNSLIVISDDASMELGKIRRREKGSSGGHNGIKSIIKFWGSEQFYRYKIGVGQPPDNIPLEAWVLSKFKKDELKTIQAAIHKTIQKIITDIQ